jgi:hypothetical protein
MHQSIERHGHRGGGYPRIGFCVADNGVQGRRDGHAGGPTGQERAMMATHLHNNTTQHTVEDTSRENLF